MVQQMQDIYGAYVRDVERVFAEAKPADGLFGWGDDPKKHPCHMQFYEAVEDWVRAFAAAEPGQEAVWEAVRFMLQTPDLHRDSQCFWFLYAAQGLTRELIPRLSREQCAALREDYDNRYPKRDRMPVQRDIYKALKKGAAKK